MVMEDGPMKGAVDAETENVTDCPEVLVSDSGCVEIVGACAAEFVVIAKRSDSGLLM